MGASGGSRDNSQEKVVLWDRKGIRTFGLMGALPGWQTIMRLRFSNKKVVSKMSATANNVLFARIFWQITSSLKKIKLVWP